MLLPDDPHVYAFTRALTGSGSDVSSGSPSDSQSDGAGIPELLVLGNFSGEERDADLGDEAWGDAELVLGNYPSDADASDGGSAAGSAAGAVRDGLSAARCACGPGNCRCCAGAAAPDRRS